MNPPGAEIIADAAFGVLDSPAKAGTDQGTARVTGVGALVHHGLIKRLLDSPFKMVGLDAGVAAAGLYAAQDYAGFLWRCLLFEIWLRHFEQGFQEPGSALEASPAAGRDPAAARRPKKLYRNPREPLRSRVSPKPW